MNLTLIVIVVIVVVLVLWLVLTFNALIRLRNEVQQGEASIDVQLKRRADLIPNLVEAVKGYASHETAAFQQVSEARSHALGASTLDEKAAADGEVRAAVGKLFAIAEAYPQLRAVESFTQLQTELADTEDKIAAARRYYNATVQAYNTKQQTVPTSFVAGLFRHSPAPFYRIEDDAERQPVEVGLTS
jgi:LemA protein